MLRKIAALVPALVLAAGAAHAADGFPKLIVKAKDKIAAGDVPKVQVIATGNSATDVAWVEVQVNGASAWRIFPTATDATGVTSVALAAPPGASIYHTDLSLEDAEGTPLWSGEGTFSLDGTLGSFSGMPLAEGVDLAATAIRAYPTPDRAVFDLAVTLVGRDVPDVAGGVLTLNPGEGAPLPLEGEMAIALRDPRVQFTAPLTVDGFPEDSLVMLEAWSYSAEGRLIVRAKGSYVLTQLTGPDGLPQGLELLPASPKGTAVRRGDILIGGEPIDIE
ncbi:hypothetical protein L6R50_24680 [Myxococcota bacterium]|nr:hypothetical protein [Myxococcota bacterium]